MKVVGLFRELGRGVAPTLPSIRDAAGGLANSDVDPLVRYLRNGVPVFDVMEASVDPFDSAILIPGGPSLNSDGVWVWRNDLAHFVEKYRIAVTEDFLAHALSKDQARETDSVIVSKWEEALDAYDRAERGESEAE